MPLSNPYGHKIDSHDQTGAKLQCDVDPRDKSLIVSLRPSRGTIQLVVNTLIKNLCDDIRELNVHEWRVDGNELLEILTERRPYTTNQLVRIGHTSVGSTEPIPKRFQHDSGGSSVREETSELEVEPTDISERPTGGIKRVRKKAATKKGKKGKQNGGES